MRLDNKSLVYMMVALAACLMLGLWIHSQLLGAIRAWNRDEQAWARLETQGKKLLPPLRRLQWTESSNHTPRSFERVRSVQREIPVADRPGLVVVDSEWRVLQASHATDRNHSSPWQRGEPLRWTTSQRRGRISSRAGQPLYGFVDTKSGSWSALAFPLPEASGHAVVYEPSSAAPTDASGESFPVVAVITFIWTAGLQCIVVFLICSRSRRPADPKQSSSEELVLRRTQDLIRTRDAVIFGLAKLAESRDPETGHHLERIALYSTRLAAALRTHPDFRKTVTSAFVRLIGISSALHDIGKVGIEDSILLKPGKLTPDERTRMQTHTTIGAECLSQIEQRLGTSNFLYMAREIAMHHHEHWDGNGYPTGLAGEQIPLSARIVAVADVYDALSSKRVYKDAFSHEKCVQIIREQNGKQFDPRLVKVFLEIAPQFQEIALRYSDARAGRESAPRHSKDVAAEKPGSQTSSGRRSLEENVRALAEEALNEHEYVLDFYTSSSRSPNAGSA